MIILKEEFLKREPSPESVDDEDVADDEAAEGEEIHKDKEGEMVDHVDDISVYAMEKIESLVTLHNQN